MIVPELRPDFKQYIYKNVLLSMVMFCTGATGTVVCRKVLTFHTCIHREVFAELRTLPRNIQNAPHKNVAVKICRQSLDHRKLLSP